MADTRNTQSQSQALLPILIRLGVVRLRAAQLAVTATWVAIPLLERQAQMRTLLMAGKVVEVATLQQLGRVVLVIRSMVLQARLEMAGSADLVAHADFHLLRFPVLVRPILLQRTGGAGARGGRMVSEMEAVDFLPLHGKQTYRFQQSHLDKVLRGSIWKAIVQEYLRRYLQYNSLLKAQSAPRRSMHLAE